MLFQVLTIHGQMKGCIGLFLRGNLIHLLVILESRIVFIIKIERLNMIQDAGHFTRNL